MRFEMRFGAVLLGAAILAGCTSVSEGEWKTAQTVMQGSPAVKQEVIRDCIQQQSATPLSRRKSASQIFNISLEQFPPTYCNRLWNAFARGRISYADYRNLSSPTADNSKIIKILQGRL